MHPSQITIEVTDIDGARQGQVPQQYWTDVKCVSVLRDVGTWEMSLPSDLPQAQALVQPGAGILILGPAGELFSGPMVSATETGSAADPLGTTKFVGVDYNVLLQDADGYPLPSQPDVTLQTDAYDVRTGAAETVVRGLVGANIGPSAPGARRARLAQRLVLEADQARGDTVTANTRFDTLLAQAQALCTIAGIGFRISTSGSALALDFYVPVDRSKVVRLDVANGRLSKYEHTLQAPALTRVLVAGGGEAEARVFLETTSADSLAAEAAWGRRIEVFKDQRQTSDPVALQQAGDEALAAGGATADTLKLTPTDDETMLYQVEWNLGDYITAVVKGREIAQVVRQVGIGITKDGVTIGAVAGDLTPDDVRTLSLQRRVNQLETRI